MAMYYFEYPLLRFLNAVFWEFTQNLPGIVLFVVAVWWWARQSRGKASLCILVGAIVSSLIIYLTESAKTGHVETVRILVVNIVIMTLLQALILPYLGVEAKWSHRKIDLIVAGLAGSTLAIAQGLADQDSPPLIGIVLHSAALAVAIAAILVNVRDLKTKTLPAALAGSVLIVVVMTLIIGLIDYSYLLF